MADIYTHLLLLVVHLIASAEQFNLVEEFSILNDLNSCSGFGGKCINETNQCEGSYVPGVCGSDSGLKCCSPKIDVQDTGDCLGLPILSRDTWGAAEPKLIENMTLPVTMFFIHHTATQSCDSTDSCGKLMRAIQRFHMNTRGWNDIAYSFLIGGDGRVYKGRGWDRVGSHTLHYDYVSLAVSFMGNFNNTMPAPAALAAANKLLMCAMQRKAITPSYSLYGHQDVRDTDCPGYTLYNAIRKWTHYNVTTDKDGPCLQKKGLCGPDYLPCDGEYQKGLCNGNPQRQCCVPKTEVLIPKPGIKNGVVDCFGNIMLLHPTGRKSGGVAESRRELDAHINLAAKYKDCFKQIGAEMCLHPAVIAGIASRESNFGFSLTPDGWGDQHNAYGIMQCDVRKCPVCRFGLTCTRFKYDSCDHIGMMTQYVLVPLIRDVVSKFPNWLPEQHIQGGVAAYNFGIGNVRSWANLDVGTTDGDYSNDVIARAQWLVIGYNW
ncbi:uncharacterized [Magallana gigas]|uniref:uncharacterized n=1 Tax=Magallana gigas TaxID=29159 RepID=UPI0033403AB1